MTGPPGPGHVTTGIRGLGMAKHARDLAKWGTGGVTGGNGQVTRLAHPGGPPRAAAVWFTGRCRRTWRPVSVPGPRPGSGRGRRITHPAQPGRSGHQLSASRLR